MGRNHRVTGRPHHPEGDPTPSAATKTEPPLSTLLLFKGQCKQVPALFTVRWRCLLFRVLRYLPFRVLGYLPFRVVRYLPFRVLRYLDVLLEVLGQQLLVHREVDFRLL